MKRLLTLLLVLCATPLFAQRVGPVNIAANTICVPLPINSQTTSVVKISVTGTFSATLQPQIIVNGNPAVNTNVTPEASTTAQGTITAAGIYNTSVAGADSFQICSTSYASGTAVISINASNGPNASLLGGGSSGGAITSVAQTVPTGFSVSGSPITTGSGTLGVTYNVAATNEVLNSTAANTASWTLAPTFGGNLTLAGASPTIATASNANLILAPNGTGTVVVPAGTTSNASIQTSGMAANTGFYSQATTNLCWLTTGTIASCFNTGGMATTDGGALTFSQTNAASGATGAKISVLGSSTTESLDITSGTSTTLLNTGDKCAPTTAVTLAASPTFTAICTWTLPNAAKTWAWQCSGTYSVTSGTTPNLQLGFIVAQAPTNATGTARASSVSAGTTIVETNNLASTAGTTQQTMLTSATLTTVANGAWSSAGSIQASATSGTLIINASMGGTLPVGSINVGSTCWLY